MGGAFFFSDRGNAANEDFVFATSRYGVLLDGVTCLAGEPLFSDRFATNAQWLSHTVGASLCRHLDAGLPAEEALGRAVAAARAELEAALGRPLASTDPRLIPSATLSLAVMGDDVVEVLSLGDSPSVVLGVDGTVSVLTDERLEALDDVAVRAMGERAAGRDLSGRERRALVDDIVRANRALLNTPDGYWCLDPTGGALVHLRRLVVPACEVAAVCGMSDGMLRAFSTFGIARLDDVASLDYLGAQALVDRMRTVEAADPDLTRYPRLKKGDDASIYLLRA